MLLFSQSAWYHRQAQRDLAGERQRRLHQQPQLVRHLQPRPGQEEDWDALPAFVPPFSHGRVLSAFHSFAFFSLLWRDRPGLEEQALAPVQQRLRGVEKHQHQQAEQPFSCDNTLVAVSAGFQAFLRQT